MTAFLVAVLRKYWSQALLGGLAVAGIMAFAGHEREIGALKVQLHTADSIATVARTELADAQRRITIDSGRAVALEHDTLLANQRARVADANYKAVSRSYGAARSRLDSLVANLPHDSGSVLDSLVGAITTYRQQADSTIQACHADVVSQQTALQACQDHARALQLTLNDTQGLVQALAKDTLALHLKWQATKQAVPGFFGTWAWRLGALGLGILAGRAWR